MKQDQEIRKRPLPADWKNESRRRLTPEFIQAEFPQLNTKKAGKNYTCPFPDHTDKHPSFSINYENGYFKCFGCGKQGKIENLFIELHGWTWKHTILYILGQSTTMPTCKPIARKKKEDNVTHWIPSKHVCSLIELYNYQSALRPDHISALSEHKALSSYTLLRHGLGFNEKNDAYVFPGFSHNRVLVDLMEYRIGGIPYSKKGSRKWIYALPGILEHYKRLIAVEGLWDYLKALDNGFWNVFAYPGTHCFPEGCWPLFKDKTIYWIPDCDKAGQSAVRKHANSLRPFNVENYIVKLPGQEGSGYDFSNYFEDGNNVNDLWKLIDRAQRI